MQKKDNWKQVMIWVAIILIVPTIWNSAFSKHNVTDVRNKIKNYLYQKYGEEFVVDRIGTRSSRGQAFYQARIYPKSILVTNKEWDEYYYASATVNKLSFGRLGGVGDSYSYVSRNIDMEQYLLPYVKEKFGQRVLLKVDVEHKVTGDGSWWAGYKSKRLKEMKKKVKKDPEHNRIELELDVYIFDRIEGKEEKKRRRKEIFEFVQYLKKEGLFEYLEMRVVIMDERVLAPSYDEYRQRIKNTYRTREEREGKEILLPPRKLRNKMSRYLQKEINIISKEDLLNSIQQIKKEDLNYKGIGKWNCHYQSIIYSEGILKEKYSSSLKKHPEVLRDYEDLEDVKLGPNLEYVYIN